ncbi:MAG: hypothetical protein QM790_10480 [Nibricoccus sp.]
MTWYSCNLRAETPDFDMRYNKQNDEDSDAFAELGNDAMVYQTIIDKIDALLLKLPEGSR